MQLITDLGADLKGSAKQQALPPVPVLGLHEIRSGAETADKTADKTADQVIDIRHPDEAELKPLAPPMQAEVINIPFYELQSRMATLDPARRYLLYCERGIMSRLHAAHLWDEGHRNLAVLDVAASRT